MGMGVPDKFLIELAPSPCRIILFELLSAIGNASIKRIGISYIPDLIP